MPVKHLAGWLALLCALTSHALQADVYTYIDAEGNRVFTDRPGHNAKRIQVTPSNSIAAPPRTVARKPANAPVQAPFSYDLLRILVPEPDATVRDTQGDLVVTVTSEPKLQKGHSFRLLLDGNSVGPPGPSPVFPLANLDRGTHQLSVEILDQNGRLLERTPNQPFHMMRISLAQKRLARPCALPEYGVRPECPIGDKPKDDD